MLSVLGLLQPANASLLVAGEYFVDNDPGLGNGIPLSVVTGDSIDLQSGFLTGALSPCVHTVFVRYRDISGVWSSAVGKPFTVLPAGLSQPTPLTSGEFFIDADPGPGHGSPIMFAAGDSVDIQIGIPTNALTAGTHTVSARFQSSGAWSQSTTKPFTALPVQPPQATRLASATATIHGILLSGAVYDTSFALSPEDGAFDSTLESTEDVLLTSYAAEPGALQRGNYTLTVAYQDDLGTLLPSTSISFEVTSGLVIRAAYPNPTDVSLHWLHSELDNSYYAVYRGSDFNGVYTFVDSTTGGFYTDQNILAQDGRKFYRVTARYLGSALLIDGKEITPLDPAFAQATDIMREQPKATVVRASLPLRVHKVTE